MITLFVEFTVKESGRTELSAFSFFRIFSFRDHGSKALRAAPSSVFIRVIATVSNHCLGSFAWSAAFLLNTHSIECEPEIL